MVKSEKRVGEDGLMDYNRSRKRSKSLNSSRSWKVMHEYFDAVDKCEEDESRMRELEEELQILRARKNDNICQRHILLDKVMSIDEISVLDMADVSCLDKLCKLGFRGRILVEELRLLQSAMDKIPLRYEICRDKKVDRISILPDELLVLILSSLSLKEAVASSILSSRWRYLWTFLTKLDFDGTKIAFGDTRLNKARFEKARLNYVELVNHLMTLHKSPDIEEFRVFFDLTQTYKRSIDGWLRFAITKKVERLELNFTAEASKRSLYTNCYTLDLYNILWADKGSFFDSINHVKYLKKIFLNHVNVDGEALAFFLCNCPLLEHLSVSKSRDLLNLKFIGPFPSFKHLEIELCYKLRSIEIRDTNLVYLKYVGSWVYFVVENLPQLVEMYIGGSDRDVGNVFLHFSNYIPQLEILTLDIFRGSNCYTIQDKCPAVKMSNLKQLIIKASIDYDDTLIPLTNLVHASPCLQKFVLKATHRPVTESKTRNVWPLFTEREVRKRMRSYPQLKEIQFVGYHGAACELYLLMHFLDNAVALEKILVDTCKLIHSREYLWKTYLATCKNKVNEVEVSARSRAMKELPVIVPPKVSLKIL